MRTTKLMLSVFALAMTLALAAGEGPGGSDTDLQDKSWELGSYDDWLSVGPIVHFGPYYYPNSDFPIGTQKFLNTYPIYTPYYYSNYYPTYSPYYYNYYKTHYPAYMTRYRNYYHFDMFPLGTFGQFHGGNWF